MPKNLPAASPSRRAIWRDRHWIDRNSRSFACRTKENCDQSIIWAREYGIPINVVDQPEACDFTVPSILERGEIVAAVGSGGAAPVLAKRVRTSLEALMPQNMGPSFRDRRDFRPRVYEVLDDGVTKRRQFWEAALNGAPADLALDGKFDERASRHGSACCRTNREPGK